VVDPSPTTDSSGTIESTPITPSPGLSTKRCN
jgi:hypothetical protein